MYNPEHPTFLIKINQNEIGDRFIEHSTNGKYNSYVSKDFYGAVIRSKKHIEELDGREVVMSVRLKGRGDNKQTVTGIKIDLIEKDDPRIKQYGINIKELMPVRMSVEPNIPGNIILNRQPAVLSAFFYKRKDGSSFINFIPKQ